MVGRVPGTCKILLLATQRDTRGEACWPAPFQPAISRYVMRKGALETLGHVQCDRQDGA